MGVLFIRYCVLGIVHCIRCALYSNNVIYFFDTRTNKTTLEELHIFPSYSINW